VISKEGNTPVEHRKHAKLAKPSSGNFGRNEWSVLGAPCVTIKFLADEVIKALSPTYKCAYADTTHNNCDVSLPGRLANSAYLEYTDQINYKQFNYNSIITPFKQKQLFAEADIVLVNGNHQEAKAQVVIIDLNKKTSLQKRVSQLNNVQLFLLADNANDVFDFVKETIPNWQQIPLYKLSETERIINFFVAKMQQDKPVLNGLVLAGGKSLRMGFDKGSIEWHGKQQRYHMADMLKDLCNEVFISYSAAQDDLGASYPTLTDTFIGLGPYGAILSAFREKPDSAWLVVACDLPLLNMATLQHLVNNRDSSAIATTYHSEATGFPEPLITIWEPKSYPVLLSFLAQGYSCPRKVLINSEPTVLMVPDAAVLTNANTPEDYEKIMLQLHQIAKA
jgi:molybdopterin-guanine dinucleotide biosynthesis protein A